MSVSNPIKTINKTTIPCDGTATVTVGFDSSSDLIARPVDVILVMDRSGSMTADKMQFAKIGAKELIATVAGASGDSTGGSIQNGSRIGIASFSDLATEDVQLTTDVPALQAAIDALQSGGSTNHESAFHAARRMMDTASQNDQIVIMFTDGVKTTGGDPAPVAEAIKKAGAEIYCIGLAVKDDNLKLWASDPDSKYVLSTNDMTRLTEMFQKTAYEIIHAGAFDVKIVETLHPDFKVTKINPPSTGVAVLKSPQVIEWTMAAAGTQPQESISLSFDIMHIGTDGGEKQFNASVVYSDRDGGTLTFPSPKITVNCDGPIVDPDPCGTATDFQVDGCEDSVVIDMTPTTPEGLGRVVQFDLPIHNVCPGKRLGVAVVLTETDTAGIEYSRGMKTFLVPAIDGDTCRNVLLKCIHFVLPEETDVTGNTDSMCNTRNFKVRSLVNYIDTDFVCCGKETVIL